MDYSRPQKIVNILSAIIVLIAGFYVLFFMPAVGISPMGKGAIGILLILYFLFRMRYYYRRYKRHDDQSGNE
ncbi:MAG: hypothetical protein CVT49_12125 [candidate division Zixibacteria bacterium HGW-Zixibacteria-1]|nr:MAG: hypothetical protein CVT49_12125 [candidate division Zixibacteria bacterium HGW-Zixibacteria-1]